VAKSMHPPDLPCLDELANQPEEMCRGGSVIVGPLGQVLAGPLYGKEDVLYATLDMGEVVRGKLDFDVVGHYARPDLFGKIG
ncbi:MAG: nitrilase, partial [Caldilineae bacterium]